MNVKRCSGYMGHWECLDDYPDHMVPVGELAPINPTRLVFRINAAGARLTTTESGPVTLKLTN